MVDVQQDGVETAIRALGIRACGIQPCRIRAEGLADHREEVAPDQSAAGVRRQAGTEWHPSAPVPLDHFRECVDHDQ
jgi:hypothetical protein